jgi:phosphoribosylanthranilate isomerase
MVIKVCGITNREDALVSIDAGANALGFNFWTGSPRYVGPEQAAAVIAGLPAGVWKVGVFVDEPAQRAAEVAEGLHLDVVQLHGGGAPPKFRVWRALSVQQAIEANDFDDPDAEAFLLDAPAGEQRGGSGRTFDWSLIPAKRPRIILAGGLDAHNVAPAVAAVRPWGVDACSRLESAPGKKDHEKVRAFVQAALACKVENDFTT